MINVELPLSSVGGTLLKHLEEHAVQGSRLYIAVQYFFVVWLVKYT